MTPLSTRPSRWRPITVFNLLVGLLISFSALGQPAFLTNGLVAYYPFNGTGQNDLIDPIFGEFQTKAFISTADRFGRSEQALDLSTEGGTVKEYGSESVEMTFSFWYKATAFLDQIDIWPKYNGAYTRPFGQLLGLGLMYYPDGTLIIETSAGSPKNVYRLAPLQVWQNIVIVLSKSTKNTIVYQNGQQFQRSDWLFGDDAPFGRSILSTIGFRKKLGQNGVDDLRIYNRALSDAEVKALYDYESAPPKATPRIASATAQVVNGFVVGATVTDAGFGYVSNPAVTITGGGGSGARATATQINGVVTSITITNPGIGYTSVPTITIAPPPFPPRKATGTAQIVNGFVVGAQVSDGGFGYDAPPAVLLVGGGGSGATGVATVANGVVTAITITNPGTGYTSVPLVRIASPPFNPKLGIETSKVYVRMSIVLGRKYQLEASADLNTWNATGPAFIAQDEDLVQEFDVNQVGRYFRINQVP